MVGKVDKQVPNQRHKEKYVIHYKDVKLYGSLGLKITKIHRGIKFNESPRQKKYNDLNSKLRT